MHRMGVPPWHTSVPMLGLELVGAAPISCSTYVFEGSVTLAFRNARTRKLFVIVFGDSLFVCNFECNLFAFHCFLCRFLFHFVGTASLTLRCGSLPSPGCDVDRGVSEQSACRS